MFRSFVQAGVLGGLMLGLLGSGCSKTDYSLSEHSGDTFSNPGRTDKMNGLKEDFNASIVIEDPSYENEHNVNRILRYLAENRDFLKGKFVGVVEIRIGSHFERREISDGQYMIQLNASATQQALDLWFENFASSAQAERTLKNAAARIGVRSIVDMKGFVGSEADVFAKALIEACKALDFSTPAAQSYASTIQVERVFAFGKGYLIVPHDADADSLRAFLGEALDLAKHLDEDLRKLGSLLGVTVSYQPGVLTPQEISAGIRNLTAASSVVLGAPGRKKALLIGRRMENDAARAKSENQLLVSFSSTPSQIGEAINLLGSDGAAASQLAIATAQAAYVSGGVTLSVSASDFGTSGGVNDGTVARIKDTLTRLQIVASPARLSASQINTITATSGQPAIRSNTLSVNFSNFDQAQLESVFTTYESTASIAQRIRLQRGILESFRSQYSSYVSVEYSESDFDVSGGDKTQALSSTTAFFVKIGPPATLIKLGIKRVVFAKGAPSVQESVVRSGETLRVDGYQATAEVLASVLKFQDLGF